MGGEGADGMSMEWGKKNGDDPTEPIPKVDELSDKRVRKEEAEGLIDPKGVFMLGVRGVRMRWYRECCSTLRTARRRITLSTSLRSWTKS